ncbi:MULTISPECIES: stressosome-associated protein Prli42 [Paenibacillus]|uniref:Stressosome-associated protein Prli42 n=1 Tax=Paenibacillus radicis (ex Xue et al. 2023) TaxID=2972489 RepID=A0ABT1YL15_9BACL|nr:stressosome-associated protein Prli42 [Paenibacillus radicis (ex Xue et al. 2023)]MCR8633880.1 stressosome-associated protein Prli42 [Paenibacillus radicis (ex Xue et al. 2023)]
MRNKLVFKVIIYLMIASMLLSTVLFTVNLFM